MDLKVRKENALEQAPLGELCKSPSVDARSRRRNNDGNCKKIDNKTY